MYCPNCASDNQEDAKFCRHCGANLGVVADALSGRPAEQSQIDERMVSLFKDYYRGRNSVVIGGIATFIALFKMVMFALINLPPRADFLGIVTLLLLIYGLLGLVWGIAAWSNSTSEIKAIERAASRGASLGRTKDRPGLPSGEPVSLRTGDASTDPLGVPGSVTEQTTRQLAERYASAPERDDKTSG